MTSSSLLISELVVTGVALTISESAAAQFHQQFTRQS
jgi:hypothetical protein